MPVSQVVLKPGILQDWDSQTYAKEKYKTPQRLESTPQTTRRPRETPLRKIYRWEGNFQSDVGLKRSIGDKIHEEKLLRIYVTTAPFLVRPSSTIPGYRVSSNVPSRTILEHSTMSRHEPNVNWRRTYKTNMLLSCSIHKIILFVDRRTRCLLDEKWSLFYVLWE